MASPASTPASTPARTHVTNIVKLMTLPPSSPRYDAPASLPPHRCTRSASSPFAPAGRTRTQAALGGGGSRRRPVPVLPHQEGGEHLDRSPVQGAVIDHPLHGGARERPDPLCYCGGAHDDVHSSQQTTQARPLGGTRPDQPDVGLAGVG